MNEETSTLKMLFLDDVRMPQDVGNYMNPVALRPLYRKSQISIVRNYKEFCNYLENNPLPDIVSFDHDLADIHYEIPFLEWNDNSSEQLGVEETGYDCANFLINFCIKKDLPIPVVYCHSMNPVGKQNILNLFK